MTFVRLFGPCLFRHGRAIYGRDEAGTLVWQCGRCLEPIGPVLAGEMITTPKPYDLAGAPSGKARRIVRANVSYMKARHR